MFCSSAAALLNEFHFDGFRVDLTQAIHRDNNLEADGRSIGSANQFGIKFLREWSDTLRLIKPNVFLIAEEHEWEAVAEPTSSGGLGFDARWYADFYHPVYTFLPDLRPPSVEAVRRASWTFWRRPRGAASPIRRSDSTRAEAMASGAGGAADVEKSVL